jgi:hypothetical protein
MVIWHAKKQKTIQSSLTNEYETIQQQQNYRNCPVYHFNAAFACKNDFLTQPKRLKKHLVKKLLFQ